MTKQEARKALWVSDYDTNERLQAVWDAMSLLPWDEIVTICDAVDNRCMVEWPLLSTVP